MAKLTERVMDPMDPKLNLKIETAKILDAIHAGAHGRGAGPPVVVCKVVTVATDGIVVLPWVHRHEDNLRSSR